jgi:hypothetical protein
MHLFHFTRSDEDMFSSLNACFPETSVSEAAEGESSSSMYQPKVPTESDCYVLVISHGSLIMSLNLNDLSRLLLCSQSRLVKSLLMLDTGLMMRSRFVCSSFFFYNMHFFLPKRSNSFVPLNILYICVYQIAINVYQYNVFSHFFLVR